MIVEHNRELAEGGYFKFNIVGEGNALCDSAWRATEYSPAYTRLYYTLSGSGKIKTEREEIILNRGKLYMIPTGMSFSYSCENQMQQLYFHINVTDSYGKDVLRGINRIMQKEITAEYTERLLALYRRDTAVARNYLKTLLQRDVFLMLFETRTEIKESRISPTVLKAVAYIEQNLSASLTLKEISDGIFVSPDTLSHRFKSEIGVPPIQYANGLIMTRAESLLTDTDISVARIAEMLGFADQFYFSRRFKEMHSVSPIKYRISHR